jgi:hypothetical protein
MTKANIYISGRILRDLYGAVYMTNYGFRRAAKIGRKFGINILNLGFEEAFRCNANSTLA